MFNLQTTNQSEVLENVIVNGDLNQLSSEDRVMYYKNVCHSVGLNPLTKPFEYIRLNGKLTLYARKDATDQLRNIHNISLTITARDKLEDVYVVTAQARNAAGRCDESIGAVNIGGLKGEGLANAIMKAETKAKRRATLSIAGLGLLDENEVQIIPKAAAVDFNPETGEIIEAKPNLVIIPKANVVCEKITEDQEFELVQLIEETNANLDGVMKHVGIAKLSDCSTVDFEVLKRMLNKKKAKLAKDKE